jgi:hypothetical protein
MKLAITLPLAALFFTSCAAFQKAPLPPREKPTRIVNNSYAAGKVRFYETYDLGRQKDYFTRGYKIAFVHMKSGVAYPIPCMPTRDGMTTTLSPVVWANPKNDAWKITTYLRKKSVGIYTLMRADLVRDKGDLYLGDKKLKPVDTVPLVD